MGMNPSILKHLMKGKAFQIERATYNSIAKEEQTMNAPLTRLPAAECLALMDQPEVLALDVREPVEVALEYLARARSLPLSTLDQTCADLDPEQPMVLICQSGKRAEKAGALLRARGFTRLHILEGGLNHWKAQGHPVQKGTSKVWSLMRQVQVTAGFMVAASVALGYFVHPGFLALAGFVGLGLMFAGVTNTCGMAMVLAKMPWNKNAHCAPAPGKDQA